MGIKNPTQLVYTAKTFMPVLGIVVEIRRDRRLAKRLSNGICSICFYYF